MTFAPSLHHPTLLPSKSPCGQKQPQGIAQVRSKIARRIEAGETLDQVRPLVTHLVRGEEYVTGSRMTAYANVGQAIGKSSSWVRKLVGRDDAIALQHFEFLNIVRAYSALCERIEAAAAAERLRAEQLRRWADAPPARTAEVVASATGSDRAGEAL